MRSRIQNIWFNFKYKYLGILSYLGDLIYIGNHMTSAWLKYGMYIKHSREFVFLLNNTHQVNIKAEPFLTYLITSEESRRMIEDCLTIYNGNPREYRSELYFEIDLDGNIRNKDGL